jgi:hypothetical protein
MESQETHADTHTDTRGGSRHILLGGPRRGQCLTRGAKKRHKYIFKDYKLSFTLKSSNI